MFQWLCYLSCFATLIPLYLTDDYNHKRTAVLIEKQTVYGQNLFIRGGVDYNRRDGCSQAASVENNPCAIPIKHNVILNDVYEPANEWSEGDDHLDWSGAEPKQGKWNGISAEGSPAIWTTNVQNKSAYNKLNTYGEHYWLLDIEMDCSKTMDGFFEVKGFLEGRWESDVTQAAKCSGSEGVERPFKSANHIAKCGFKNVFRFNDGACEISKFK